MFDKLRALYRFRVHNDEAVASLTKLLEEISKDESERNRYIHWEYIPMVDVEFRYPIIEKHYVKNGAYTSDLDFLKPDTLNQLTMRVIKYGYRLKDLMMQ